MRSHPQSYHNGSSIDRKGDAMKYIVDFLFNYLQACAIVFGGMALFDYIVKESTRVL